VTIPLSAITILLRFRFMIAQRLVGFANPACATPVAEKRSLFATKLLSPQR